MFEELSGKRYLVTGGSSGIGRETAKLIAELGGRVCLNGRNPERITESLRSLAGAHHDASAFDLLNVDGIPQWMKELATNGGAFAGVVHCAGIHEVRLLRMTSYKDIERVLRANVATCFGLARGFRQKGVHEAPGSVVFVSSVAGSTGLASVSAYSASKGAVNGLTRSLAMELAGEQIRVNAVAPGIVRTEMTDRMFSGLSAEQVSAIEREHPLGFGEASDVANAIVFLLSSRARWITGSVMAVDGGYCAH